MVKGVVYLCEQDQRSLFRESDGNDAEVRHEGSLFECEEGKNLHEEKMKVTLSETMRPYVLNTNHLCMVVGCASKEVR